MWLRKYLGLADILSIVHERLSIPQNIIHNTHGVEAKAILSRWWCWYSYVGLKVSLHICRWCSALDVYDKPPYVSTASNEVEVKDRNHQEALDYARNGKCTLSKFEAKLFSAEEPHRDLCSTYLKHDISCTPVHSSHRPILLFLFDILVSSSKPDKYQDAGSHSFLMNIPACNQGTTSSTNVKQLHNLRYMEGAGRSGRHCTFCVTATHSERWASACIHRSMTVVICILFCMARKSCNPCRRKGLH